MLGTTHELVTLEGRGDLISRRLFKYRFPDLFGTQNLAHAAQVHRLRSIMIQGNDVFDGATKVRLPLDLEQDAAGTYVLRKSSKGDAFSARPRYGEGEMQFETPGTSLFH